MDPLVRELLGASDSLRRLALSLAGDEHLANDAVQEAWLAALRRRSEPPQDPAQWARTVVRRVLFGAKQRERRQREQESLAGDDPPTATPAQQLETRSFLQLIAAEAEQLKEPYRTVIRLRYWEDLSPPQIAERLGRPRDTIKTQLRRGLELLRARLDDRHDGRRAAWLAPLRLTLDSLDSPGRGLATSLPPAALGAIAATAAMLLLGWALAADRPLGATASPSPEAQLDRTAQLTEIASSSRVAATPPGASTSTPTPSDARARIHLTVVDDLGRPVPGAEVRVLATGNGTRTAGSTGPSGEYELVVEASDVGANVLMPDNVGVTVSYPGYATAPWYLGRCPPGSDQRLRIELPGPELTLKGLVVDTAGRPIPGALVERTVVRKLRPHGDWMIGESAKPQRTDASGSFTMSGLRPASHRLAVDADGWIKTERTVEGRSGGIVECRLVLRRACSVAGVVRDARGRPVVGARMTFDPEGSQHGHTVVHSGPDGSYRIDELVAGPTRLWAQDPALSGLLDRTTLEVREGQLATWDPVLERAEGIALRVTGPALADADCVVVFTCGEPGSTWERTCEPNAAGTFEVYDVPRGHPIRAAVLLHPLAPFPIAGRSDLRPGPDVVEVVVPDSEPTGSVSGTLQLQSGARLGDAQVRMGWGGLSVSENVDPVSGAFTFRQVPGGEYALEVVTVAQGVSQLGPLVVAGDEPTELGLIELPPTGRLTIAWSWPESVDGTRVFYTLRQLTGPQAFTVVASGPAPPPRQLDLLPGRYTLVVEHGARSVRYPVTVESNREVAVEAAR